MRKVVVICSLITSVVLPSAAQLYAPEIKVQDTNGITGVGGVSSETPGVKLQVNGNSFVRYGKFQIGFRTVQNGNFGPDYAEIAYDRPYSYANYPNSFPSTYPNPYRWQQRNEGTMVFTNRNGGSSGTGGFLFRPKNGSNYLYSFSILGNGRVGVNTATPHKDFEVNGEVLAKKYYAKNSTTISSFPDFVFEKDYHLTDLKELELYIEKHKHLPGIPSATEVKETGIELVQMNLKLLQKIEELTLHVIQQHKENLDQQIALDRLSDEVAKLKKR